MKEPFISRQFRALKSLNFLYKCKHFILGTRGGISYAPSQESLASKFKKKDMFGSSKTGALHRSPSKESVGSMGSVNSDTSFFCGGQSRFSEVSC